MAPIFQHLPDLNVQAFDRINGVDDLSNFRTEAKKRNHLSNSNDKHLSARYHIKAHRGDVSSLSFSFCGSSRCLRRACHVPFAVCTVVPKIARFHPVLHRGLTVLAYHNLFPRIPRQLAKRLSTRNPCCPAFVTHHRSRTCSTNRMWLMHSNASGQP